MLSTKETGHAQRGLKSLAAEIIHSSTLTDFAVEWIEKNLEESIRIVHSRELQGFSALTISAVSEMRF